MKYQEKDFQLGEISVSGVLCEALSWVFIRNAFMVEKMRIACKNGEPTVGESKCIPWFVQQNSTWGGQEWEDGELFKENTGLKSYWTACSWGSRGKKKKAPNYL